MRSKSFGEFILPIWYSELIESKKKKPAIPAGFSVFEEETRHARINPQSRATGRPSFRQQLVR
jgi:hypothetical protein